MSNNPYETGRYLHEYLLFHYGQPLERCPFPFAPKSALDFHQQLLTKCLRPVRRRGRTRGLDIGCAVGRLTFELARVVDHAVGLDNSQTLIRAARSIAATGRAVVHRLEERDTQSKVTVTLPRQLRRRSVEFHVADAENLAAFTGQPFDVVLAVNLLCRLRNPKKFLAQLPDLVARNGQLLIASPYSWLNQYTPRHRWIRSADLPALLRQHFRLSARRDMPFLIREHRRKYQWVVSEVLTFRRR